MFGEHTMVDIRVGEQPGIVAAGGVFKMSEPSIRRRGWYAVFGLKK